MLHFVLDDINPTIAKDFSLFLKEMNEISVLISVANAPYVTSDALVIDEGTGMSTFNLKEGDYEARFKGKSEGDDVISGYFEVFEDQKRLLEISYSIQLDVAISLRVKLNCEGEYLVREELERAFERDFSQEAHEYMTKPLEELRKPKSNLEDEIDELATGSDHALSDQNTSELKDERESHGETSKESAPEELEDLEEITEELSELTQKVQDAIVDTRTMIALLNNLSHDLTRGGTINFGEYEFESKTLENGAKVELLDDESNAYKITFRKGSIEDMTEVSFFLEKEGVLIFSVYFSSEGVGRVTSSSEQSELILKKVKYHLL